MRWKFRSKEDRAEKTPGAREPDGRTGLGATRPVGLKTFAFGSNSEGAKELLLQALELKIGGAKVYEAAIRCATNAELATQWGRDLNRAREQETILRAACEAWGLDEEAATTGRSVVTYHCKAFVAAMENALANAAGNVAQLSAAECIALWETMDGLRKEAVIEVCEAIPGKQSKDLRQAFGAEQPRPAVQWARGFWMQFLGRPTVLPPQRDAQDAETQSGAIRARPSSRRIVRSKPRQTASRGGRSTTTRASRTR